MISSVEPGTPSRAPGLRVLFTDSARPVQGFPAAALGWAFRAAGHDVLVAGEPALVRMVTDTGLPVTTIGSAVDDLVRLAIRWRPDLIVHGPTSLAAVVAGAVLDVPTVGHLGAGPELPRMEAGPDTGLSWSRRLRLFARFGVEPRLEPVLWVDPCPPSLGVPAQVPRRPVRFVPAHGPRVVPAWLFDPPIRPRVCVPWWAPNDHPNDDRDIVREVLAGLTTLDAEIVLTVDTPEHRPGLLDRLGPLLEDAHAPVRVVDSVALPDLLHACDAVVHQGRPDTTMTAAACGTPQLIVADEPEQELCGDRLVASGAGRFLSADDLPSGERGADIVGSAAAKLLDRPAHGSCAQRLREEIGRQPTPAELVDPLVRLVANLPASTSEYVSV